MTDIEAQQQLRELGVSHVKSLKLRDKFRVGLRCDELAEERLAEVEALVRVAYPGSLVQLWRGKVEIGRWESPKDA